MKRSAAKPISAGPQAFVADQTKLHINQLCRCLAQEFQPEKITLFGSYAYGQPHHFSNIDLLVIMPFQGSPFRQAGIILHRAIQQVA